LQNIAPRYQQRSFPKEKRINKLVTVVSNEEGLQHCWINQNTKISLGYYEQPESLTYTFQPQNKCLFIFLISGSLRVQDQGLQPRDAIGIWETGEVSLKCADKTEFVIIETPINQK
jgi:redox-sensitive bicupin YhaK (pirin superfamily)